MGELESFLRSIVCGDGGTLAALLAAVAALLGFKLPWLNRSKPTPPEAEAVKPADQKSKAFSIAGIVSFLAVIKEVMPVVRELIEKLRELRKTPEKPA